MRAVVFANGPSLDPSSPPPPPALAPGDLVIAADGGARHCLAHGIRPRVVIGDFDSLSAAELEALVADGAEVVRYPPAKDFTDLDLALQYAAGRGVEEILVHGALGRRWDMTLANLLLAAAPHLRRVQVGLVDGDQTLWTLRGGRALTLRGEPGDTVSLIPLCGDAEGVTTEGLAWPLANETLAFGATRGVSNALVGRSAAVRLARGLLVCAHATRPNPAPAGPRRPAGARPEEMLR